MKPHPSTDPPIHSSVAAFWILAAIVTALLLLTALPGVAELAQGAEAPAADELAAAQAECEQFEAQLYVLTRHRQRDLTRRQRKELIEVRRSVRKLGRHPGALPRLRDYVALRICQQETGDEERDPGSVGLLEIFVWIIDHPDEIQKFIDWLLKMIDLFSLHQRIVWLV